MFRILKEFTLNLQEKKKAFEIFIKFSITVNPCEKVLFYASNNLKLYPGTDIEIDRLFFKLDHLT
jgi:hypothetical protein